MPGCRDDLGRQLMAQVQPGQGNGSEDPSSTGSESCNGMWCSALIEKIAS